MLTYFWLIILTLNLITLLLFLFDPLISFLSLFASNTYSVLGQLLFNVIRAVIDFIRRDISLWGIIIFITLVPQLVTLVWTPLAISLRGKLFKVQVSGGDFFYCAFILQQSQQGLWIFLLSFFPLAALIEIFVVNCVFNLIFLVTIICQLFICILHLSNLRYVLLFLHFGL